MTSRSLRNACCLAALALALPASMVACETTNDDTYTLGLCGEAQCTYDQACRNNEECVFYPCDATADPDPCKAFFNNGFACSETEQICLQMEGYCDAAIVCQETWQDCTDNLCANKAEYCDETTTCDAWQDCTEHLCTNKAEYCDETTTCEAWQDCTDHLCVDKAAYCPNGHTDCTAGQFCREDDSLCTAPDNTCTVAVDSGVTYTTDAPVIWVVGELDDMSGADYAPGGAGGVPADDCTDGSTSLHAYELHYYAPQNDFPIASGLYSAIDLYTDDAAGSATWFVYVNGDTTTGMLVVFLCILDSTTDAVWALTFDDGTVTSDAVCFDVNPTI